jgi:hypothetical protein
MAKKDGKKKKDTKGSGAADTVEAVRSAVERALPEGSRDRGRELVDEVARAVSRVRVSLEQHGVFEELGKLRNEVETLARRVANLERPGTTARSTGTTTTTTPRTTKAAATRSKASASKRSRTKASSTKAASAKTSSRTKAASTKRSSTTKRSASRSKPARSRTSGSGS